MLKLIKKIKILVCWYLVNIINYYRLYFINIISYYVDYCADYFILFYYYFYYRIIMKKESIDYKLNEIHEKINFYLIRYRMARIGYLQRFDQFSEPYFILLQKKINKLQKKINKLFFLAKLYIPEIKTSIEQQANELKKTIYISILFTIVTNKFFQPILKFFRQKYSNLLLFALSFPNVVDYYNNNEKYNNVGVYVNTFTFFFYYKLISIKNGKKFEKNFHQNWNIINHIFKELKKLFFIFFFFLNVFFLTLVCLLHYDFYTPVLLCLNNLWSVFIIFFIFVEVALMFFSKIKFLKKIKSYYTKFVTIRKIIYYFSLILSVFNLILVFLMLGFLFFPQNYFLYFFSNLFLCTHKFKFNFIRFWDFSFFEIFNFFFFINFILLGGILPLLERKYLALIQRRVGPIKMGFKGRFQFIADAIKVFLKDYFYCFQINKFLFFFLPFIFFFINMLFSLNILWSKNIIFLDIELNLIWLFTLSSISNIILFLVGFYSRNKYSIIAASRIVNVFFINELLLSMFLIFYVFLNNSFSFSFFIFFKHNLFGIFYFIYLLPILIYLFLLEVNRTPFDYSESESELIMGCTNEHMGFIFGVFVLIEYIHIFVFIYFYSLILF